MLLEGSGARLLTPADLGISGVPEETGSTPAENAAVKAAFYSAYCDRVLFCGKRFGRGGAGPRDTG